MSRLGSNLDSVFRKVSELSLQYKILSKLLHFSHQAMSPQSAPKTILITGGNSGIGYELVRQLAALGHNVYLTSRSEQSGKDAQ